MFYENKDNATVKQQVMGTTRLREVGTASEKTPVKTTWWNQVVNEYLGFKFIYYIQSSEIQENIDDI